MLNNWRVRILTAVVAVGGAYIIGVPLPARAAEVTYNLVSVESAGGVEVTGYFVYDGSNDTYLSGEATAVKNTGQVDYLAVDVPPGTDCCVYYGSQGTDIDEIDLTFDTDVTGTPGQVLTLQASYVIYYPGAGSPYSARDPIVQGEVVAAPSVPESSSILATVTAVTIGVVLRGKKRKI